MFDRCTRPVMPSATLAESRLSRPPSRVKLSATGNTVISISREIFGRCGIGNP